MTKYVAIIDYKARPDFGHIPLTASNLLDAMDEAETLFSEDVYLVDIAEKSGKGQKVGTWTETPYKDILRSRGCGWHRCDHGHSESPVTWIMSHDKNGILCFTIGKIDWS